MIKIKVIIASAAALVTLASTQAFAQITEELVVTAQKREQSVAEVPIAITVLSESQISNSYSANIEGLQFLAPSLTFKRTNALHNNALIIRGIGTVSFSFGIEPSVAVAVDNVVLGRIGQAFADLYEIERLEVLKGPQGTLFGKNASTGVLNITTKKPTEEFQGSLNIGFYTGDEYKTTLRLSGALADNVNGSITVYQGTLDGYIHNRGDNRLVNGYDRSGVRAMVDYDAGDGLSILGILEQFKSNDDCCFNIPGRIIAENETTDTSSAFQANWKLYAGEQDPNTAVNANGLALGVDTEWVRSGEVRDISSTSGYSFQVTKEYDTGSLVSISSYRSWDHEEINDEDMNDQTYYLAPNTSRSTISGPEQWNQFNQEIRFDGSDDDLNYSVGAYFWHQTVGYSFTRWNTNCNGLNDVAAGSDPRLGLVSLPVVPDDTNAELYPDGINDDAYIEDLENYTDVLLPAYNDNQDKYASEATPDGCAVVDTTDLPSVSYGDDPQYFIYYENLGTREQANYEARLGEQRALFDVTGHFRVVYENQAVFFNLNYQIDDNWGLTVGSRFTSDNVKYWVKRDSTLGFRAGHANTGDRLEESYSDSTAETNLSSKFGFEWKGDTDMVYFSYSQGYKGPGFNLYYNYGIDLNGAPIKPETSNQIEIGYKATFDDAFLTLAWFQLNLDDYQTNTFVNVPYQDAPIVNTSNAGSVVSSGIEFDFLYKPDDSISLSGGLYMGAAEFDEFDCGAISDPTRCTDHKGLPIPYASDLKWNLTLDINHQLDANDAFLFNISYSFTGEQLGDTPNIAVNSSDRSLRANGTFCLNGDVICDKIPSPTDADPDRMIDEVVQTTVGGVETNKIGLVDATYIPEYSIVNMSIGYSFDQDAYRVNFVVKNLFDDRFFAGYSGTNAGYTYRYQFARDSFRYWGLDFKANF